MVLQLADDLDVLALLSEHLSNFMHISCLANKGGKDHVDSHLDTKLQVFDVFLRDGRKVNSGSWQIDTLLATQSSSVLNFTDQIVRA